MYFTTVLDIVKSVNVFKLFLKDSLSFLQIQDEFYKICGIVTSQSFTTTIVLCWRIVWHVLLCPSCNLPYCILKLRHCTDHNLCAKSALWSNGQCFHFFHSLYTTFSDTTMKSLTSTCIWKQVWQKPSEINVCVLFIYISFTSLSITSIS